MNLRVSVPVAGAPVTRSSYVLELAKRGAEAVPRSKAEKKS